jgi:hypothetical protein
LHPPITDPQIQILNFRELAWPDYQKLVVSIARDIDGHREAVLWVQDPNPSPDLGLQLASDPHVLVRRSLASEIASSKELRLDNPVALRLATDERHSVRRAIQRKAR